MLLANLLPPSPKGLSRCALWILPSRIFSDTGVLEGVLGAHINWEWAEDLMGNTLAATDAGIALQILSRTATSCCVLATTRRCPRPSARRQETARTAMQLNLVGWQDLSTGFAGSATGYELIPVWVVIDASQPLDAALEPANRLQQQIGLITGLLAISFLPLAGLFTHHTVTSPLRAIVTTARGMRANDTPSAYNQADEIAGLAATLSQLFTDLNERDQELADLSDTFETRVTERTHTAERRARQSANRC